MDSIDIRWGALTPEARQRLLEILDDPESWSDAIVTAPGLPPRSSRAMLLRNLSESLPLVTFLVEVDEQGYELDYVSERIEHVLGLTPDEVMTMGAELVDLVHPNDILGVFVNDAAATETMDQCTFELRLRQGPDAPWRWYFGSTSPESTSRGSTKWYGILLDVDDERRAEERSRRALTRFEAVFRASDRGLAIVDLRGTLLEINDRALQFSLEINGKTPERGEPFDFTEFDRTGGVFEDLMEDAFTQKRPFDFTWTGEDLSGRERMFDINISPLVSAQGHVEAVIVSATDLTERHETQQRQTELELKLASNQRVEALGMMAAGVAHDFNNLLMLVSTHANLIEIELEEKLEQTSGDHSLIFGIAKEIDAIEITIERARQMTTSLLAFAGRQPSAPTSVRPSLAIHEAAQVLRPSLEEDIDLVIDGKSTSWCVLIDPSQFEQMLFNLVLNARDAVGAGGSIRVGAKNVTFSRDRLVGSETLEAGEYVRVTVTDDGHGIPEDVISRIFDPFFTTKEEGKGTGLGLATCFGIVRGAGGAIECESRVEDGTTFRVFLPREKQNQPTRPRTPTRELPVARVGARVLLAEDQEDLRNSLARLLRRRGYDVVACEDGEAALDVLADDRDFAILVTDVVMPRIGGVETARAFARECPGAPILYMSGYADDVLFSRGLEKGTSFVQKPCAPGELLEAIAKALEPPE